MPPRVLLIGGNDRFAAGIEDFLRRKGLEAQRAPSGAAVLQALAAAPPHLLLIDLPTAPALDLLRRVREAPPGRQLPVILFGGPDRQELQAAAAPFGQPPVLPKPLPAGELLRAIGRLLVPPPAAYPFPRHLQRAFAARFSGTYRLGTGSGSLRLFFLHGHPVALSPGFIHRDFGDYLRRQGVISADEERWFREEGGWPGLLTQLGCLPFTRVWPDYFDWLQAELLAAFSRPPLPAQEEPWASPPGLTLPALNVPALLHEGFRRHPDPAAARQLLTACGSRYIGPTPHFYRWINFLSPDVDEIELLRLLDGTRTLQECVAGRPDPLPLLRTLNLLQMARLADAPLPAAAPGFPQRARFHVPEEEAAGSGEEALESFADVVEEAGTETVLTPPPGPVAAAESSLERQVRETRAALEGKDHYGIFGMNRGNFSFDRLKEAYFRLTREFGPETLMRLSGEEAKLAEEILAAISAAYNTLSDVVKKERYDELLGSEKIGLGRAGDERFHAQVQFQSGKVFLQMEDWESAEKALQDACTVEPGNGLYLAHLAWALYRNPAHARSLAMREKSRQLLQRALTLERTAEGHAFRGRMLLDAGQDGLAEPEFNKAVKLNPRLPLARAGLREIQERREQEKKGLLRKLFS